MNEVKEIRDKVEDLYLDETQRLAFLDENKLDDRYVQWLEKKVLESSKNVSELIDYIEKGSEIAIPVNELFNKDGQTLTKKEYGLVVIKYLAKELREKYVKK